MEWTGYDTTSKLTSLAHIFNQDQIEEMESKVGKSIFFTHLFTETVKSKNEDTTFTELLQLKVSLMLLQFRTQNLLKFVKNLSID